MRWALCLVLAAGVLVGLAGSAGATEPAAPPAPAPEKIIDVEVDVADLSETWAGIDVALEAEVQHLLAEEDELPPGVVLADDRRVFIEIWPSPIPGTDDLVVHVEIQLEGETIGESVTDTCLTCTTEGVAELVMRLLLPLLVEFPEPAAEEPPAPAMADARDEAPLAEPRARPRASPLLITGATLLGAGLVGVGVGAGLIAANERVVSPLGTAYLGVVKYREVGIATAVIGGAAALGGAVVLGLGLGQRRDSTIAATPTLGPTQWGVSLTGRF